MTSEVEYRDSQYSRMLLVLGCFIAFGVGIAVGAVFGDLVRLGTWILGAAAVAIALIRTRIDVTVDAAGVSVNRASIAWAHVQRAELLEGSAMLAATSTDAHPRDFLRLRGTNSGLRLWLNDDTDPHRAWLISVREPRRLRGILDQLVVTGVTHA